MGFKQVIKSDFSNQEAGCNKIAQFLRDFVRCSFDIVRYIDKNYGYESLPN